MDIEKDIIRVTTHISVLDASMFMIPFYVFSLGAKRMNLLEPLAA